MTRVCLVAALAARFGDTIGRLREAGVFRVVDPAIAFGFDFGLFIGSSKVCTTSSAAPPQPRPGKTPGRAGYEVGLSRLKSPQQRSVQARLPVNSEQDCCPLPRFVQLQRPGVTPALAQASAGSASTLASQSPCCISSVLRVYFPRRHRIQNRAPPVASRQCFTYKL
jgi:hypothetical protein